MAKNTCTLLGVNLLLAEFSQFSLFLREPSGSPETGVKKQRSIDRCSLTHTLPRGGVQQSARSYTSGLIDTLASGLESAGCGIAQAVH